MKNLKICASRTLSDGDIKDKLKDTQKMCIDSRNERYFFAKKDAIIVLNSQFESTMDIPCSFDDTEEHSSDNKVELFDFLNDDSQLCIGFSSGQICTINVDTNEVNKIFEFGDSPILGAAWSPDFQVLVIATKEMLYLLSRDFEIIAEETLRPSKGGIDELTTIGWGSHETQFKGSNCKKIPELDIDRMATKSISEHDDRRITVTWRADAQFFAVNSVDEIPISDKPETDSVFCRQLRIWNRNLELVSKCQFLNGMEACVCIKSVGNLIASTCFDGDSRYVWFFERNGQFRTNSKNFKVPNFAENVDKSIASTVQWNLDSSVFMICLTDQSKNLSHLQFWTVSNYSWMEKLQIDLSSSVISCFWDPESSLLFHYLTNDGSYNQLKFSIGFNCKDMIAISMNGSKFRVTDLFYAPVPPPMCHFEQSIEFGPSRDFAQSHRNQFAFLSSDSNKITTYELSEERRVVLAKTISLTNSNDYKNLYHLSWINSDLLSAVSCKNPSDYEVVRIDLQTADIKTIITVQTDVIWQCVHDRQIKWTFSADTGLNFTQVKNDIINDKCCLILTSNNPSKSCRVEFMEEYDLLVCLDVGRRLVINGQILSSRITDFSSSGNHFILFTDIENNLFCVTLPRLKRFVDGQQSPRESFEKSFLTSGRPLERGSKLVSHETNGTRVWLQMNRGNLEIIHPRIMLLWKIKEALAGLNYKRAFLDIRKHSLECSFMYFYNTAKFISNIGKFVDDLDDADYLNFFLTSFHLGLGSMILYDEYEISMERDEFGQKINTLCSALRKYILGLNSKKRIHDLFTVVLTTFVTEQPYDISGALNAIRRELTDGNSGEMTSHVHNWLRHLSFVVDDKALFNESLKTYDLEIVALVAQASNQDPKEYEPIITGLQKKSPPNYQKYHIDLLLKDWPSALKHIAHVVMNSETAVNGEGSELTEPMILSECFDHIKKHSLYPHALQVFHETTHYSNVCKIYAEHLYSTAIFSEASIFFKKAQDFDGIAKCYIKESNYRDYIDVVQSTGVHTAEELGETLNKMAIQLEAKDQYSSAAEVLSIIDAEKYSNRIANCYAKAGEWSKLVKIVEKNEALSGSVQEMLNDRCKSISSQIAEWQNQLRMYAKRLDSLRATKLIKLNNLISADNPDNEYADNLSELSESSSNLSSSSHSSLYSSKSSKIRTKKRKQVERKKKQIKEGSQYEDAAILVRLKEMYKEIDSLQDELKAFLLALLHFNLIKQGQDIQTSFISLILLAENSIVLIWPEFIEAKHLTGPISEMYRMGDGLVQTPHSEKEVMPSRLRIDDELCPPKLRRIAHTWRMEAFNST